MTVGVIVLPESLQCLGHVPPATRSAATLRHLGRIAEEALFCTGGLRWRVDLARAVDARQAWSKACAQPRHGTDTGGTRPNAPALLTRDTDYFNAFMLNPSATCDTHVL